MHQSAQRDRPLLETKGLTKHFTRNGQVVLALDNVTLTVDAGRTLALVGPSGSGKSTLARIVMRLVEPDSGKLYFGGENLLELKGRMLRKKRRRFQMVFQDPIAAFNPRATVLDLLSEPLRIHSIAPPAYRAAAIKELLRTVELSPELVHRRAHELSGGQRQRIAIARALATQPELVVLDEALSALDVVIRAGIVRLLQRLQDERGIAYLFISHDLALVRAFAPMIAIIDQGRIVESGKSAEIIANPASSTGKALVAAAPRLTVGVKD